jgi:hypothetical protein
MPNVYTDVGDDDAPDRHIPDADALGESDADLQAAEDLRMLFNEHQQDLVEQNIATAAHFAGPRNAKQFLNVVKVCRGLGVDPEKYLIRRLRVAFPRPIYANQVLTYGDQTGPSCVKLMLEVSDDDLAVALNTQLGLVRAQTAFAASPKDAMLVAVTCSEPDVTPLLRWCLAVKFGLRDVARRYEAAALRQFNASPDQYRNAWASVLPRRLLGDSLRA